MLYSDPPFLKQNWKKKKVIVDEINMYLDTPEENIFDEFQERIFDGHPLAHNILGTEESSKPHLAIQSQKFCKYPLPFRKHGICSGGKRID